MANTSNTTSGAIIPEWHSIYPSGGSVYAPSGHISFVITANDTTQPEFRPKTVSLPAQPSDSQADWATVAQHSLGVFGTFQFSNVSCSGSGKGKEKDCKGNKGDHGNESGPSGTLTVNITSATLPSDIGYQYVNTFKFTDDCNKHVLVADFGGGLVQTVWFYRLPQFDVFA
ncbi:hypothetical protein JX265_002616 [Neoarthrinium moseri]|uniref:Lipocalin-like domain-containing protein n=1 Tax=Neoarthrinium moseri TaxID=1658444 RepID=A0A9P9WV69_9PEZI|nr:hypothetical protein JX265_002616 [Neoarthrinium moseri]